MQYYRAFTLIELIVVLIVIATVATVGIQQYTNMTWKAKLAEVYQNVGILTRAEKMYYLMNSVYANINNPSGQAYLGNGYAAGSTDIQKQLGVGFPQNSLFTYLVAPYSGNSGTYIYFYQPSYGGYCARYNYVAGTWTINGSATAPACKYFTPPT